jgi:hypothetical protein
MEVPLHHGAVRDGDLLVKRLADAVDRCALALIDCASWIDYLASDIADARLG